LAGLAVLFGGHAASAVEMPQVYTGSLDQPRINMLIRIPGPVQTDPLDGTTFALDFENIEIGEATTWNLTGFLDTGASAILIATSVAAPAEFDIPMEAGWTFEDVGVAGAVTQFGI